MRRPLPGVHLLVSAVLALAVLGSGGLRASHAQPAEDPALLRELAERLLGQQAGPGGDPPPRLLPGEVGPLSFTLPQPAGTRVIGSMVRTVTPSSLTLPPGVSSPAGDSVTAVLDVPLPRQETQRLFESALAAQGWTPPPFFGGRPSPGFQVNPTPAQLFLCGADQAPASITLTERQAGVTEARVQVGPFAGPFCTDLTGPRLPPPMLPPALPTLRLPAEARGASFVGSGGGPATASSAVAFDAATTPAELEQFFARQLAEAEWTRLDGGSAGTLAWSAWRLPGDDEQHGYLFVLRGPTAERRYAEVLALGAGTPGSPGGLLPSSPFPIIK